MSPAGVGVRHGRIRRANLPYQTTTPALHTLVCRHQPRLAIAMKTCPGSESGSDSRHSSRHWYEKALKRLSSAPTNPTIRHSREGGNPRTNIPRKNSNRDTTTYLHTATPLRLSGESTPEPRYGAGIQRGVGGANFHTLVCRHQPAWAIGTKACPGLRSGMADQLTFSNWGPFPAGREKCSAGVRPQPRSTSRPCIAFWRPTTCRDDRRGVPCGHPGQGAAKCRRPANIAPRHCNENRPLQRPLIGHSRHPFVIPAPQFVVGTKACPGLRSGMPQRRFDCASESHQSSVSSFRRRACPVPRYGAGIQRGGERGM